MLLVQGQTYHPREQDSLESDLDMYKYLINDTGVTTGTII